MAVLRIEHEEEVKAEARWPTVMLQSSARQIVWSMCSILGVYDKGVPGSSCRLLERCLSRHIRTFLNENRSPEEFSRYKELIVSKFFLLLAACAQLAAKMSDLQTPLNASRVRQALLQLGVEHSTAEIVRMESRVFAVLGAAAALHRRDRAHGEPRVRCARYVCYSRVRQALLQHSTAEIVRMESRVFAVLGIRVRQALLQHSTAEIVRMESRVFAVLGIRVRQALLQHSTAEIVRMESRVFAVLGIRVRQALLQHSTAEIVRMESRVFAVLGIRVRQALLQHSTAEIVRMESRVFAVLDYHIPVWNSLETAEFLADRLGLNSAVIIKALEVVINAMEYRRDVLELNMKSWLARNRPTSVSPPSGNGSGSAVRLSMHNLHVCAAGVVATLRYMQHAARAAAVATLAALLRVERRYLRAMVHAVLKTIFTPNEPCAPCSKKRRYV
ncbi:hypothetical protein PYW07_000670 [Mythimna separata]|uniref:Uncharacterized protein n=1 Tax=Mythimna separata TaxID=271217 RepID=A0AAD7Z3Z0_MYTSE|nr:hypothetical protein PYW07_000670 [Mythimna separata]